MSNEAVYQSLFPADLAELDPTVRRIDVREPLEFDDDLGHLDGAELVPLGTLPLASTGWRKEQPLLLICRSGKRRRASSTCWCGRSR